MVNPLPSLHRSILTHQQADKLRAQQQLEALQTRYVGTGHADTTKFEWASNIQRDSYASYVGHPPLLSYMAIGMGECREKVRAQMIEVSGVFVLMMDEMPGSGKERIVLTKW